MDNTIHYGISSFQFAHFYYGYFVPDSVFDGAGGGSSTPVFTPLIMIY